MNPHQALQILIPGAQMTAGENTSIVPDLRFLQHDTPLRVEAKEKRRRHVRTVLKGHSNLC
jgi:hypothetical protein